MSQTSEGIAKYKEGMCDMGKIHHEIPIMAIIINGTCGENLYNYLSDINTGEVL